MKIGIVGDNFITWGGGIDLLKLYINSLYGSDNEILLLIPIKDTSFVGIIQSLKYHLYVIYQRVIYRRKVSTYNPNDVLLNFKSEFPDIQYIFYDSGKINYVVDEYQIDILFPCNRFVNKSKVPWIGYIYDFQHKYLPDYFSKKERALRDKRFSHMLMNAPAIVCNSYDVKKDCDRFFPEHKATIYVTPFSPLTRAEWLDDNSSLLNKYNINFPYLIICNQFWLHKDHFTAIKAFAKLIEQSQYADYHMICTGDLHDTRNYNYIETVKKLISSLGLEHRIHLLGYIPKIDQIELIKSARVVVQPTTFEGGPGGGVAYDAISLGKPIVLSDIPINKEVKGDKVYYFKTGDESSLLETIINVLCTKDDIKTVACLKFQTEIIKNELKWYLLNMLNAEMIKQKEKKT